MSFATRPAAVMDRDLAAVDPEIARWIAAEARRQNEGIELIASENWVSRAVREAQGSVLTNKYAEGYPGKRYYGGCEFIDQVEQLAIDRAKALFHAEHANVQPHSGSQANMAVYLTALEPGDTILGMDLSHGGHLTHGHPLSFSGREYKVVAYGVRREDERIDYDALARAGARAPAQAHHRGRLRVRARDRLRPVRRRGPGGRRGVDGGHRAHRGPRDRGPARIAGSARALRDDDDAQDPSRPAGRARPLPGRPCQGSRPQRLPGHPGRPARARHRGQGRGVRRSVRTGVRGLPETRGRQREGPRRGAGPPRVPPRVGGHRQPPHDGRRRGAGHLRQGRGEAAGTRGPDRQQEHDSLRYAAAGGRLRASASARPR